MNFDRLKQSYVEQLVKAGVEPQKAEQAAKTLNIEELKLIGLIWPEWAAVFYQEVQKLTSVGSNCSDVQPSQQEL